MYVAHSRISLYFKLTCTAHMCVCTNVSYGIYETQLLFSMKENKDKTFLMFFVCLYFILTIVDDISSYIM